MRRTSQNSFVPNKKLFPSPRQIITIHEQSHEICGSPRVFAALKKKGVACSEKRVARLMHTSGLRGRVITVTRRAPGVHRFYERHANLRLTEPAPSAIDQQWVGDVTFLRVQGQQCFLSALMDLYSRKILGWSLATDRTMQLTTRTLARALKDRTRAPGCIFHSDRGVKYGGIQPLEAARWH
jgi:putative transposase